MKKQEGNTKATKVVDITKMAEQVVELGIILATPREEVKEVKISLDRSQDQYTIRIPKGMAKALNIDPNKDAFEFILTEDKDEKLILKGEIKRDGKQD